MEMDQQPVAAPHLSPHRPANQYGELLNAIREFLTFKLGNEEYGIDILRVKELRSYENPTRMANSPNFIKGVINMRGVIVPIIDMRIKFNLENIVYDSFTVVIVLTIGAREVGIVVDSVSDVIALTREQLHPVPQIASVIDSDHLLAIGSVGERMLALLDIEKLMSSADMGLLTQVTH